MARPEIITITMRELDRLKTVQAVVDRQLKPGLAAVRLGLTDRQLRRLVERYWAAGPVGLVQGDAVGRVIINCQPTWNPLP